MKSVVIWSILAFILTVLISYTQGHVAGVNLVNNKYNIEEIIKKCEESLPRDQHCGIVVSAKRVF